MKIVEKGISKVQNKVFLETEVNPIYQYTPYINKKGALLDDVEHDSDLRINKTIKLVN